MMIITGATGQLGRQIVEKLARRVSASQIGASCRSPEKAADLKSLGVRVRQGDFGHPEDLPQAFEGVTQLLLVSSNARASGGDSLAQHRNAIEAAIAAGAKRVVYTSQMAASPSSAFPPMHDHAATEEMLRQSGIAWTALRHGFYAESGLAMMGHALKTGELETAADGRFSWVAHADLAEAAAIILKDEGRYDGPTPPLTGSQALDFGDLTEIASTLQDQPVRRKTLADDEMRAKMTARGTPASAVDMIMGLYIGARNEEWATVDPTLEQLIGHQPMAMRELIAKQIG